MSFFGMINVGEAHCHDDCLLVTPISTSLLISFIRVALCICGMGYGLPWYGVLAPSFSSIETGGRFQSPNVPSKSDSYSSSNESSFSCCNGVRWEQLSLTIAGRFALSYLAASISITLLVAFRGLTGSWAWHVVCRSALVMLGLSYKLTIFLIGRRILSMDMVFSLKSNTAPIWCNVCLPMLRSYKGAVAVAPASYSTMLGVRWIDLLSEYSTKERLVCILRSLSDKKEVTTRSCVEQYPYSFLFNYLSLAGVANALAEIVVML